MLIPYISIHSYVVLFIYIYYTSEKEEKSMTFITTPSLSLNRQALLLPEPKHLHLQVI